MPKSNYHHTGTRKVPGTVPVDDRYSYCTYYLLYSIIVDRALREPLDDN